MLSLNNRVQIRINGNPAKNSGQVFTDRKYLNGLRFEKIESEIIVLNTNDYFKTTEYENIFQKHIIASYSYERRYVEIEATESLGIDEMQTGDDILVIDENNIYYQCILDEQPSFEKISNTTLYKIKIILKVIMKYPSMGIGKAKLKNEEVYNDYVTSNYLLSENFRYEYYTLVLSNYEDIGTQDLTNWALRFYSKFIPKLDISENKVLDITLANGYRIVNKLTNFSTIQYRCYLTETERNLLKKYSEICYFKQNNGVDYGVHLMSPGNILHYWGVKPVEVDFPENVELNNLGIYQADITIFTEKLNYSHYRNWVGA